MPNLCDYGMRVVGKRDNIEEFIKVINGHYDYATKEFSYDRHLFRVFDACTEEIEELGDGSYGVNIYGYCAWSVYCCMFETSSTSYYQSLQERYPNDFRGTSVPIESKRLDLDIEIFSEESGMGFMEHYLVRKGDVEIEDCIDYRECYVEEYDTKEEAEEEEGLTFTDEEWNNREDNDYYIKRGGIEWDFEI